jgi:outer membrane protein assembly factor BamA
MLAVVYGILLSLAPPVNKPEYTNLSDTIRLKSSRNHKVTQDTVGRYLQINRTFVIGNRLTRDNIILRELSLKSGDIIYSLEMGTILEKDQRKIFNLHLFNSVNIRQLELESGKVDLVVEVDERWYTFPIPVFQLSDRNFNEWWQNYNHDFERVTYGLKLYQHNVRGRNETLLFTGLFGFQKQFKVTYRIPYIDKKQKQGLILDLDFSETKNVAYRTFDHKLEFLQLEKRVRNTRGIGLTYTFRNSFYRQHLLKYEYRDTEIADTLLKVNPAYLGSETTRQRYDAISYEFISDNRDVVAYPLHGYHLILHAQQNGVTKSDELNKTEGWASYAHFFDLKNNFFLSNFTFAYLSTPETLPYYNYGVMGYNKLFVRGYEIYVIEGPRYVLNKTTFKKKLFSQTYRWEKWPIEQFRHVPLAIYFKTYADIGYVENYPLYKLNSRLSDKFLAGAGAGFDLVTGYDIVLRFEYTFTAENRSGFFFHIKKEF